MVRLALAQINVVVGDLDGNVERVTAAVDEARRAGADLVLLPELAVTGYPPEDLLLRPGFVRGVGRGARRGRAILHGDHGARRLPALRPRPRTTRSPSAPTAPSRAVYLKHFLPNYGVFDEHRYFAEGRELVLLRLGEVARRPDDLRGHLAAGPAGDRPRARRRPAAREPLRLAVPRRQGGGSRGDARHAGAGQRRVPRVLQPRRRAGRARLRRSLGRARRRGRGARAGARVRGGAARRRRRPARGDRPPAQGRPPSRARAVARRAPRTSTVLELGPPAERRPTRAPAAVAPFAAELEQIRLGLGLGLRDYVRKNGFSDVVLGISGGIDSAVTAAICVDALGVEHVHTVSMPSRFSSPETRDDAREVSENLGVDFREIAIESVVAAFHEALGGVDGLAAENLQARVRGHDPDDALERRGLAGRHDGQQVGDGGRLRDALRRHGRRVRAAQGRVQDRRLPPRAAPERPCRSRADPGDDDRAAADRRAPRRPARRPVAAALRRARPRARGLRRARPLARGAARRRSTPTSSTARSRSSTAPSTSAARRRPA